MNTSKKVNRANIFRFLLALLALQGAAAVPFLFRQPSEAQSAFLFGLSLSRLVIVGGVVTMVAILLYAVIRALLERAWFLQWVRRIDKFVQVDDRLWRLLLV
ncbi:MAG: hypothetical protein K8R77_02935, partial [Anaerolineaceae bacterium]|nr:hypothetical protein [Anaerolineaceae bacterium]